MIVLGLFHILFSVFIAFTLALFFGKLTAWIAVLSLLVAVPAANSARKQFRAESWAWSAWRPGSTGWLERVLFAFVLFTGVRHFLYVIYVTGFEFKAFEANNIGDLPMHIAYIKYLASGLAFPPINPHFPTEPLRYPYAMNFYNALWEAAGVHLSGHLFAVGVFSLCAALVALRVYGSWWAVGGFFLNGGFAGWALLKGEEWGVFQKVEWKNLFISVFITQRGFLFALPAGLFLLATVNQILRDEWRPNQNASWLLGFLWGGLAFFHLHTFVILSLIVGGLVLIHRGFTKLKPLLFIAVPLGAAFSLHSSAFFSKAGFVRWSPGWTNKDAPFYAFAFENWGPYLLLLPLLVFALWRLRDKKTGLEALLHFALFALFLNLMLAPWDWDNIKLLIWPYLGLLAIAHVTLNEKLKTPGRLLVAGLLFFSGGATLLYTATRMNRSVSLMKIENLNAAEGAVKGTSKQAVFAAAMTHDHVLNFLGRMRAIGYLGHIWSHGIHSEEHVFHLNRLMKAEPGWRESAAFLGVTHIFWGPQEREQWGAGRPPWPTLLVNVSPVSGWEVYQIDPLATWED